MTVDLPPPDPRTRVDAASLDAGDPDAGPRLAPVLLAVVVGLLALGGGLALVVGAVTATDQAADVTPEDALRRTLSLIEESEQTMLTYQRIEASVLGPGDGQQGGEGLAREAAGAITAAATEARDDLADLRRRLDEAVGEQATDEVAAVRDRYVDHLEAWRDVLGDIADDPSLAVEGGADQYDEVNQTGADFVAAVEAAITRDTPEDIREQAREIVERGFRPPSDDGEAV